MLYNKDMPEQGREHDMRNGKLNKREMETIRKACDILNGWIDWQEERGIDSDNDLMTNRACVAVVGMVDFIAEYERS